MRGPLLIAILVASYAQAQELVVNGGFETYKHCPVRSGDRPARGVAGVRTIGGMPGYFHACSDAMGTPANWAGSQIPYEGDAYMGIVLTAHGGGECAVREFIQLELGSPLMNGGKYLLSFRVSLADRSGYTTDRIGASFSNDDRSKKKGITDFFGRPAVDNAVDRFIADTTGWITVEGIFNAHGGERYVQIGNFQSCDRTSRKAVTPNRDGGVLRNAKSKADADLDTDRSRGLRRRMMATQAYVYVDAVSLIPQNSAEDIRVLDGSVACTPDPGRPPNELDLVPDPSFDDNVPTHAAVWQNAGGGTPDLMKGVTGIYLYSAVNRDHREFIRTPLKERLDPCGTYDVRMRVRRDGTYAFAVDRIGVALADTFENDRRREPLPLLPVWELHGNGVMDDTDGWTTLCGSFASTGCASHLLVGNFAMDDSTLIVQRDTHGGPFAYYLVDDISLWRTGTIEGCTRTCTETLVQFPVMDPKADPVARNEVEWPLVAHFEVNDAVPQEVLRSMAEALLTALAERPTLHVTIDGHTDDSGTAYANEVLSTQRARAVRNALVDLGLPPGQLHIRAFGSTRSKASNLTPEGRAKNRRVEVNLQVSAP
ncbi:MAG: OmpA family protein [Flavobacteriales bacterium]|jgi:hypothetical protein|nr:OmpA family protein [Flavobacteriales bacterium]MBK6883883.1 OmpA family protein [Flavobacteriales bacterium]MBK7100275.1 OmpA family protein [Flavobacteriales bacterium]MBK7110968.1 OmpA family protein [Flavobacteriales bacterium]MBK7617819.1 OmpA family protein [Flavobacteriales bacterium]